MFCLETPCCQLHLYADVGEASPGAGRDWGCQLGVSASTVCPILMSVNGMLGQKAERRRGAACFSCHVCTSLLRLK